MCMCVCDCINVYTGCWYNFTRLHTMPTKAIERVRERVRVCVCANEYIARMLQLRRERRGGEKKNDADKRRETWRD